MMSYKHFTLEERICLQKFLSEGYSFRKIADMIYWKEMYPLSAERSAAIKVNIRKRKAIISFCTILGERKPYTK